jgi:hypothetical protein
VLVLTDFFSAFESAPEQEQVTTDGGWWTDVSGGASTMSVLGSEAEVGHTPPESAVTNAPGDALVAFDGVWTEDMSRVLLGEEACVKSVVFPAGVTAIGDRALQEFGILESVVFPPTCTKFGYYAFYGCRSLKAISLSAGTKHTGVSAFEGCRALASVEIPAGCVTIGGRSFWGCTSVRVVKIPSGCKIGAGAFQGCSFERVAIPDGCEIGASVFQGCRSLTVVTIGVGCEKIGVSSFYDCAALATVTIGTGCTTIEDGHSVTVSLSGQSHCHRRWNRSVTTLSRSVTR